MPVFAAGAQGQIHGSSRAHTPPSTSKSPPLTVTVPPHRDLSPHTHPVQKQTLMHLPLTHKSKPTLGVITKQHLLPKLNLQSQALRPLKPTPWNPRWLATVSQGTGSFKPLLGDSGKVASVLPADATWQPSPGQVRAQRSEEHTHCKSDLAVLLSQVTQVSWDVGLQPQVLSVHGILLEGKDPPDFSFLSRCKGARAQI